MAVAVSSLLSLSADILLSLPFYLRDIEDFISLAATCRLLHELSLHASPRTILHLAAAASRIFFRPDPHFLIAATARQVGEWAFLSSNNTTELRLAFRKGMEGLLELALEHAGLTMERIRELCEMRFSTINPVVDLVDQCIGEQWWSTPNSGRAASTMRLQSMPIRPRHSSISPSTASSSGLPSTCSSSRARFPRRRTSIPGSGSSSTASQIGCAARDRALPGTGGAGTKGWTRVRLSSLLVHTLPS